MSTALADLKAEHQRVVAEGDEILRPIEAAKRKPSAVELDLLNKKTARARDIKSEIDRIEAVERVRNSRAQIPSPTTLTTGQGPRQEKVIPKQFSSHYVAEFFGSAIKGRPLNPSMYAALEEGTNSLGGFAVPSIVADDQYVPLAPTDSTIRQLATVITTKSDLKIPFAATLPTAAAKSEGSAFATSDSSLGQFTLTANACGVDGDCSLELVGDAPVFMAAYGNDRALAISELEESWFVNGTGTGQAQGLLGNVGAGVTGETADGAGNLLSIDATFDVMGTLKAAYHKNASWLMAAATGIELRKAQIQANLVAPVFTTVDGQDYLHGRPVYYSSAMPAIAAGATPVLYGDFKQAYIIGDRGGPAVFVKVVDQDAAKALLGVVRVISYRRVDGRVRRSEAVQGITLHT